MCLNSPLATDTSLVPLSLRQKHLFLWDKSTSISTRVPNTRHGSQGIWSNLCQTSILSSWSWNMVTAKWIPLIYDSLLSLWGCLFAHHNQKCQRILSNTQSTRYCQRSYSLSSIVLHRRNSEVLRLTCPRSGSWTRAELREEPKDLPLCSSTASDVGLWCGNLYLMSYRM